MLFSAPMFRYSQAMSINPARMTPGQLKILKAMATLLENPSKKLTVNQLAKEIHVTEGAIYRHYRSKEAIFDALATYMEANLLTPLNAAQSATMDTYQRLNTVFLAYMEFLEGHPGLARLLLGHSGHEAANMAERIKLLNAKLRAQVAQILKFGQAQGVLKNSLTPEQGTELFYGLVIGVAMAQAFALPQIGRDARWAIFATAVFNR
ncbi:MAG: TetR family transcriptional regulator [Alphaproteobacteria bacterium]